MADEAEDEDGEEDRPSRPDVAQLAAAPGDESAGDVDRRGPSVLAADSWDVPAQPVRENDDYQGRRRATGPVPRLLLILALVLAGAGALAIPWALTSAGRGVAAGPSPAMATNAPSGGELSGSSLPPEVSSTSALPIAAATPSRPPNRPSSPSPAPLLSPSPARESPTRLAPTVVLLSSGRPTATSALEDSATLAGANAVDGNPATRWGSAFSDPQWISVDLGSVCSITSVRLSWETAYARSYEIQTSADNTSWTTIYATTTGDGGVDEATVTGSGRWVRVFGSQRATGWGYSLWELEIFGTTT